eukprot:g5010.t1
METPSPPILERQTMRNGSVEQQTIMRSGSVESEARVELDNIPEADELVTEYLLFRGFTETFHAFSSENKKDRLKSFNVERIVESIFSAVEAYDFDAVLALWDFLDARFFSHLEGNFDATVQGLERALQRYCVVYCIRTGKQKNAVSFFESHAKGLTRRSDTEWRHWFGLPFLPDPANDPYFGAFFTDEWAETLRTSLQNFLDLILHNIPMPKLLAFGIGQIEENMREAELHSMRATIEHLKMQVATANAELEMARAEITQLAKYRDMWMQEKVSTLEGGMQDLIFDDDEDDENDEDNDNILAEHVRDEEHVKSVKHDEEIWLEDGDQFKEQEQDQDQDQEQEDEKQEGEALPSIRTAPYRVLKGGVTVLKGHTDAVLSCKFSPGEASYLASGGADATVRIWQMKGWPTTPHSSGPLTGGTCHNTIYCSGEVGTLGWMQREKPLLLFGTTNRDIKLWDVSVQGFRAEMQSASDFPNVIFVGQVPGTSSILTSAKRRRRRWVKPHHQLQGQIQGQHQQQQLQLQDLNSSAGIVQLWDVTRGRVLQNLDIGNSKAAAHAIAINRNGSIVCAGCTDGTVHLVEISSGKTIASWQAHHSAIASVLFTQDETGVITSSAGEDDRMIQWELSMTPPKIDRIYALTSNLYRHAHVLRRDMALDALGNVLVTSEEEALIYRGARQSPVQRIGGHSQPLVALDWAPEPGKAMLRRCATACVDGNIVLTMLQAFT